METIDDPCDITCRCVCRHDKIQFSWESLISRDSLESYIFVSVVIFESLEVGFEVEGISTETEGSSYFRVDHPKFEERNISYFIRSTDSWMEKADGRTSIYWGEVSEDTFQIGFECFSEVLGSSSYEDSCDHLFFGKWLYRDILR